jgi:predicted DCC family thiol-disulfide oxidoreductase YuxK
MVNGVNDELNIIFFDGVCNLCNYWVKFVIRNDPDGHFRFASLQSDFAINFLKQNEIKSDFQSIVLYTGGKFLIQSDAVLSILYKNGGFNKFLSLLFQPIPLRIRNVFYKFVASNRYHIFGMQEQCMIPNKSIKNRFL